jgi:hypothetical protein
MANAMNRESGLPERFYRSPKQLNRMTVPHVIEHVSKINEYRAAKLADVNEKLADNEATEFIKEYPDGNRWVQLRQPDVESGINSLQEALTYEGDQMGHCVGDYCEDVSTGHTLIYSLRDKSGGPHVTIEATYIIPRKQVNTFWEEAVANGNNSLDDEYNYFQNLENRWLDENREDALLSIDQVKGKQNLKPNEKYSEQVQDFILSLQDQRPVYISEHDLENTDLVDTTRLTHHYGQHALAGGKRYITRDMYDKIDEDIKRVIFDP